MLQLIAHVLQIKSLSAIFNGPDMYVISRGERFIPMGALSDPGLLSTSGRLTRKRKAYNGDLVANRIKNKRDKLSKTSEQQKHSAFHGPAIFSCFF